MGSGIRIIRSALVCAVLVWASVSLAHEAPRTAIRELVRLQGMVQPASGDVQGDVVELSVNGKTLIFRVDDRQVFIAVGASGTARKAEPERLVVQGQRELLARIVAARPNQRVTLLAERRPGASEIFVSSVDLCPDS